MKITLFEQAPYRYLPPDFERKYSSVCSTPYSLITPERVYSSIRDFIDELFSGVRLGFDGVAVTEHAQSAFDMMPNPDLIAALLAYTTEADGIDVAIFPMGRSLGKAREPLRVAEEYAMIDVISGGRLVAGFPVGLSYDANINNGVPPMQTRPRFDENLELVLRAWTDTEPFAWNGKYAQHPQVNIWPRPLQSPPPVWITGIGNPNTMRMVLERGFGFNYFSFYGAALTARRILRRFWEIADSLSVPRNPYRVGFLQAIAIAETDERAEREYKPHIEYALRKSLGSIPRERRSLPGSIDIRGVEALLKDPGDLGMSERLRTASFREMADADAVIVGSPATVRDKLMKLCQDCGVGNLHVMLGFGSLPREMVIKNIHMFAEEVAPGMRELWRDTGFEHHWWPERLGGTPPDKAGWYPTSGRELGVSA